MLISRFKGIAYSPILLTPLFLIIMLSAWYFSEEGVFSVVFLVSTSVFVLWLVLIYFVMKIYFTAIKILPTEIRFRSFLGKGKPRSFAMNSIDGYEIQQQSGETNSSEVIFIYQNGKIVLRISELFYQNYKELKKLITQKLKRIPNR
jgi:hypothetical protein